MSGKGIRQTGTSLAVLGLLGMLAVYSMAFFWVGTDRLQGVSQRIFYIHVPAWWIAFLAFGLVALCIAVYLWLGDDHTFVYYHCL